MPKPKFRLKGKAAQPKDLPIALQPIGKPAVSDDKVMVTARWDYSQTQGGCNVCRLEPRWVLVVRTQGPTMGHETRYCKHHASQLFTALLQFKAALEEKHDGG